MSTHDAETALSFVRVSERFSVRFLSGILPIVLTACHAHSARPSQGKLWEEFSGAKALAHVQRLVDLGPRPPGSDAIEKSRAYIDNQLKLTGWQVERQRFTSDTPQGKVEFVNLIARFSAPSRLSPMFLLCSHYDTKFFPNVRFVGANDGGSSTRLPPGLARVLGRGPALSAEMALAFFAGVETCQKFLSTY